METPYIAGTGNLSAMLAQEVDVALVVGGRYEGDLE
jgi:hypothetical protein